MCVCVCVVYQHEHSHRLLCCVADVENITCIVCAGLKYKEDCRCRYYREPNETEMNNNIAYLKMAREPTTSTTLVHLRAISVLTEYILLLLLLSKYQAIRMDSTMDTRERARERVSCFPLKPLDKNQHHHHLQFQQ